MDDGTPKLRAAEPHGADKLKALAQSSFWLDTDLPHLLLLAPEGRIREELEQMIKSWEIKDGVKGQPNAAPLLELWVHIDRPDGVSVSMKSRPVVAVECRYFGGSSMFYPSTTLVTHIEGLQSGWAKHAKSPEEIFPGMDSEVIDNVVPWFLEKVKQCLFGLYGAVEGFIQAEVMKLDDKATKVLFDQAWHWKHLLWRERIRLLNDIEGETE